MKKKITFLLTLCMVISLFAGLTVTASAAESRFLIDAVDINYAAYNGSTAKEIKDSVEVTSKLEMKSFEITDNIAEKTLTDEEALVPNHSYIIKISFEAKSSYCFENPMKDVMSYYNGFPLSLTVNGVACESFPYDEDGNYSVYEDYVFFSMSGGSLGMMFIKDSAGKRPTATTENKDTTILECSFALTTCNFVPFKLNSDNVDSIDYNAAAAAVEKAAYSNSIELWDKTYFVYAKENDNYQIFSAEMTFPAGVGVVEIGASATMTKTQIEALTDGDVLVFSPVSEKPEKAEVKLTSISYNFNQGMTAEEVKASINAYVEAANGDKTTATVSEGAQGLTIEGLEAGTGIKAYTPYTLSFYLQIEDGYRFPNAYYDSLDSMTFEAQSIELHVSKADGYYGSANEHAQLLTADGSAVAADTQLDDVVSLLYTAKVQSTNFKKMAGTDTSIELQSGLDFNTAIESIKTVHESSAQGLPIGSGIFLWNQDVTYVYGTTGEGAELKYLTFKGNYNTITGLSSGEEKSLSDLQSAAASGKVAIFAPAPTAPKRERINSVEINYTGIAVNNTAADLKCSPGDDEKYEMTDSLLKRIYFEGNELKITELAAGEKIEPYQVYQIYMYLQAKDGYRFANRYRELRSMTFSCNGTEMEPVLGVNEFGIDQINSGAQYSNPQYKADKGGLDDEYIYFFYYRMCMVSNYEKFGSEDTEINLYKENLSFDEASFAVTYSLVFGTVSNYPTVYVYAKNGDKYMTFSAALFDPKDLSTLVCEQTPTERTLEELQTLAGEGRVVVLATPIIPVAWADGNEYETLQEAVDAVGDGGTVTLNAANSEAVTVSEEKTFSLDKNGKSFSGTITAAEGYELNKTEADDTITYTVTEAEPNEPTPDTPDDDGYLAGIIRLIFNFKAIQFFSIGEFLARITKLIFDIFR